MTFINIATVAYNKPEFIKYQYRSFIKFIRNKFDYTVYDNTVDDKIKKEVYAICNNFSIPVVNVPNNSGDNSIRAGSSLNFAIDDMRRKSNTNVMLVDSDIFLADYYDVLESLGNYDLLGRYWNVEHLFYYTNHLLQVNLSKLPADKNFNFLPVIIDNIQLDCGGALYNYFRDYPEIKHGPIRVIPRNFITAANIERYEILNRNKLLLKFFRRECDIFENRGNFSELFQDVFVHLRAGSNWIGINVEKQKLREENLYNLINSLTQGEANEKNY